MESITQAVSADALRLASQMEQLGEIRTRQLLAGLVAFAAFAGGQGYPGTRITATHPGTSRAERRSLAGKRKRLVAAVKRASHIARQRKAFRGLEK